MQLGGVVVFLARDLLSNRRYLAWAFVPGRPD
jgi:hypothetical protein